MKSPAAEPKTVVFVAPFPADVTLRFIRAAAAMPHVKLLGVVHTPPGGKDANLFHDVARVENPMSIHEIIEAIHQLRRKHGEPDRIIGILEAMQVQLAHVREHFGVAGTSVKVADLFRDKARMKEALAAAGLPVARSQILHNGDDAKRFVKQVGLPIVIKPPAGVGTKSTYRINTEAQLQSAVEGLRPSKDNPLLAEEFLRGTEYSFDTITVGGEPKAYNISHYDPTCLDAVENPWIQWCCMLPKDISGKEYDGARDIGFKAVKALGLEHGMTHMEWFRREDGSLAIGEIAQRPAGANVSIMCCYAHDISLYQYWCRAVIDHSFDAPWQRKYAVGTAFLRGVGKGRVAGTNGLKAVHQKYGAHICEARIPDVGAPKSDSYEGDGYVVVRHERTEAVKEMLQDIIKNVRVFYA